MDMDLLDRKLFNCVAVGLQTSNKCKFFSVGVYGPLLGYLLVGEKPRDILKLDKSKYVALAIIIPVIVVIPSFILKRTFRVNGTRCR